MVQLIQILVWIVLRIYAESWKMATDPDLYPSYHLIRVVDGDTIVVSDLEKSIRLIGIDTPEVRKVGWRNVGEFSKDASRFTKGFLKGGKVHLSLKGRDRYGRYLAHVLSEKGWLNYSLLENGLARVYFFRDTMDYRTYFLAHAYRKAFYFRRGIFSKYESAPVLKDSRNWKRFFGRIVWMEGKVRDYQKRYRYHNLDLGWALVTIRDEEYEVMFGRMIDLEKLVGKKIRAFGELYDFHGKPYIVVRMPFEIVVEDRSR